MQDADSETLTITAEEVGQRLDKILAERYKEVRSRSYFQNLIDEGKVLLNGAAVKKRARPDEGDEVEICFVLTPEIGLVPEPLPLEIIYEDADLLVVNKAVGMVVHPAPGNWSGTFVNALLYHCQELPGDLSNLRPGIVHRLDKDTSGVLIAAKTALAQAKLIEMFSERKVRKEYAAICLGNPGEGTIDLPIGRHPVHRKKMAVREKGGREAVTHFKTVASNGAMSLVSLIIETGRTHQIRVHLKARGTPVLGDATYGNLQANAKFGAERQLLHARSLELNHPVTGKYLEFVAEIPPDMANFVRQIERR